MYVCITGSEVTAVSHLSAQKTFGLLVYLCICMPLNFADHLVFYLYAPIQSAPRGFMGSIYAHSYGQPILVRFSAQCTGLMRSSYFLGIDIRTWVSICVKTGVSYRYGSLRYFLYKEETITSNKWRLRCTVQASYPVRACTISLFK